IEDWKRTLLRQKLIDRLPTFYERIENPGMQLQIESSMLAVMQDAKGDYRPPNGSLLERAPAVLELLPELIGFDEEMRIVTLGFLLNQSHLVPLWADQFETYRVERTLVALNKDSHGMNNQGPWSNDQHRLNYWIARLAAAYCREDWALCDDLLGELKDQFETPGWQMKGITACNRICSKMRAIVLDQIMGDEADFAQQIQFWQSFETLANTYNQEQSSATASHFIQLLGRDMPPPTDQPPLILERIDLHDPRWTNGPDGGAAFRKRVNAFFTPQP
ncbi:MAG: hypothetical protein AAF226_18025, partial [Verrucomicrobiota bacterium]